MAGWIRIYRDIWDSPVATKDPEYLAVWLYLLTHAAYKPYETIFEGVRITVNKGQLITGRKKIAEITGVNESKIFRILKRFEIEQQIEQQTKRHGSIISIVNWERYQETEQQTEQQKNNNRTTREQQENTKKENKEYKKEKEKQEVYYSPGTTKALEELRERMRKANQKRGVKK